MLDIAFHLTTFEIVTLSNYRMLGFISGQILVTTLEYREHIQTTSECGLRILFDVKGAV